MTIHEMCKVVEKYVDGSGYRYSLSESKTSSSVYYRVTKYGRNSREFKIRVGDHPVGSRAFESGIEPDLEMDLEWTKEQAEAAIRRHIDAVWPPKPPRKDVKTALKNGTTENLAPRV